MGVFHGLCERLDNVVCLAQRTVPVLYGRWLDLLKAGSGIFQRHESQCYELSPVGRGVCIGRGRNPTIIDHVCKVNKPDLWDLQTGQIL